MRKKTWVMMKIVQITDPTLFQETLLSLLKQGEIVFSLFTASIDDTNGLPWCPDARKGNPVVYSVLKSFDDDKVVLIECPLQRHDWKENPNLLYKADANIAIKRIPTLIHWKLLLNNTNHSVIQTGRLVEEELASQEKTNEFVFKAINKE